MIDKQLCQNGAGPIPIAMPISCLNTMLSIVKKHLFVRKDIALARACLVKYLPPASLEVRQIDILKKSMCFRTLDLNTKLITSGSTFRRSLCGIVIYNVLKSKVEVD